MPVVPGAGLAPLDLVTTVMNAARVKLGQKGLPTLDPVSGKLLDWTQAGSQQLVNNAYRKFQQNLSNLGFTLMKPDRVISALPVMTSLDPASRMYISWDGCFDGTDIQTTPVLPPDLLVPLKVWQRPSGMNAPFPRDPMEIFVDGIPDFTKQTLNAGWEWREAAIWLPGAIQQVDLRILYQRFFSDFADDGVTPWFQAIVPIPDSLEAFACWICAEIDPDTWTVPANDATKLMVNREVSMKLRGNIRRQSRSGRLEGAGMMYY